MACDMHFARTRSTAADPAVRYLTQTGANGLDGPAGAAGAALEHSRTSGNNPDTLVAWIRHPHRFNQVTAMPEMGVGEQEARDIAAYLYPLQ